MNKAFSNEKAKLGPGDEKGLIKLKRRFGHVFYEGEPGYDADESMKKELAHQQDIIRWLCKFSDFIMTLGGVSATDDICDEFAGSDDEWEEIKRGLEHVLEWMEDSDE